MVLYVKRTSPQEPASHGTKYGLKFQIGFIGKNAPARKLTTQQGDLWVKVDDGIYRHAAFRKAYPVHETAASAKTVILEATTGALCDKLRRPDEEPIIYFKTSLDTSRLTKMS